MWIKLLRLQWKSLWRSKAFRSGIGMKILMGFGAFYLLLILLSMGVLVFAAFKEGGFENPYSEMNK